MPTHQESELNDYNDGGPHHSPKLGGLSVCKESDLGRAERQVRSFWNVRSFWKFQLAPKRIPMERVPVVLRLAQSDNDSGYILDMSTGQVAGVPAWNRFTTTIPLEQLLAPFTLRVSWITDLKLCRLLSIG
jgi:hypothetical protein